MYIHTVYIRTYSIVHMYTYIATVYIQFICKFKVQLNANRVYIHNIIIPFQKYLGTTNNKLCSYNAM